MENILVLGACGQLGGELTAALRLQYGTDSVVAADIQVEDQISADWYPYVQLDVLDKNKLGELIERLKITQVYHLAAMLSANGELNPQAAWRLNIDGLLNVLDLSLKYSVKKVFWPSSIAVFGPDSPKTDCPQQGVTEPSTIYGISKIAGEYWCKYYFEKFGLDVRSLRYPGLISYTGAPGGGTTDYAVDIFRSAAKGESYTCFLKKDTALPMMYMRDAIRATIELMSAPVAALSVRTAYNLGSLSFTPEEIYREILKEVPGFEIDYAPDFRQGIADSWPHSIDDGAARDDWGWKPAYNLEKITAEMLTHIKRLNN